MLPEDNVGHQFFTNSEAFMRGMKEIGIPEGFLPALFADSDWGFVIKAHAMIESGLNKMIVNALNDKRLADIVANLDTGDRRRGKMAFVKALDLLNSETRSFIAVLSELRNDLAHGHGLADFAFSFRDWVSKKTDKELKTLRDALTVTEFIHDGTGNIAHTVSVFPRSVFTWRVLVVMLHVHDHQEAKWAEMVDKEIARLDGLIASFEAGQKSTPKEQ